MVKEFVELVEKIQSPEMRIAEIGVYEGDSTIEILPIIQKNGGSYIGVDLFDGLYQTKFFERIQPWRDICKIVKGTSWEVAEIFPDMSFDLVYIDASHAYSSVMKDIAAWSKKVKVGGHLGGHDFNKNWVKEKRYEEEEYESDSTHYGVSKAVTECFPNGVTYWGEFADCQTWIVQRLEE